MAAGNEWINGYLEAILDAGSKKPSFSYSSPGEAAQAVTPSRYSPTKYFIEEVVNRFDDSDLHKTWIKVPTSPIQTSKSKLYIVIMHATQYICIYFFLGTLQVVATRNSQERNNRMENMCWRIWHLARKKKQVRMVLYGIFLYTYCARACIYV